jgi:hypothetical protein
LRTDGADAARLSSEYASDFAEARDGVIHIPMSPGEYCCLSGPGDAMAILCEYFGPDVPNPGDPVTESDQDQSAGPDCFE